MTETTQAIPIEIRHRWEDRVVYRSETAKDVSEAVVEAVGSGANLRGANLGRVQITSTASVAFTGHGQCGRHLVAVRVGKRKTLLWCGCFHGTPDELRAFIAGDDTSYRKTRTLALDTVLALLDAKND